LTSNEELEKEVQELKKRVEHQDKMIEYIILGNFNHAMNMVKALK